MFELLISLNDMGSFVKQCSSVRKLSKAVADVGHNDVVINVGHSVLRAACCECLGILLRYQVQVPRYHDVRSRRRGSTFHLCHNTCTSKDISTLYFTC